MAESTGGEHRVQILGRGSSQGKGSKPEKHLNRFVRAVALIERVGNALGTLAFTWATVILLGGYPTVLGKDNDFWYATAIVFLEAARMFSRNNRLDYQLFFHTKGAVRPIGWNGLIVIVYLSNVLIYVLNLIDRLQLPETYSDLIIMLVLVVPSVLGPFLSSRALRLLSKPLRYAISLCSPLVAILLLAPLIVFSDPGSTMAKWIVFSLLFLVVLLLTVTSLRFHRNTKPAEHARVNKQVIWHRLILNLCMFSELVMLVFITSDDFNRTAIIGFQVYVLVAMSFGNLQIPAAVTRVVLSLLRLVPHNYGDNANKDTTTNLAPSLDIFYGMVLGQGILYVVACMLEIFSFIPRRRLIHLGGLRGHWGVESVSLYYAYAVEKSMEGDVLAPKKISLNSFAMYCLNSDTAKMQLYGIQIMHSLLRRETTRKKLFSELITSTKMMARLIEMLDWTSPEDTTIRLFATKVIAELARNLRVVTVPGTMQIVSALLDADSKPKRESALLDTDDEQVKKQDIVTDATNIPEERHDPIMGANADQWQRQETLRDTSNLLEAQVCSNDDRNFCFLRWWKRISRLWPNPQEEPATDHDNLPALGLSILDSLAYCDYDNCMEISRTADLIPKIIGFTSYKNDIDNANKEHQKILMESSLKLLRRLSNTGGEIGITLRHKISEHPILLRNLAEILDDSYNGLELQKLVAGILRNLAINWNTSQEIGCIQVIIRRLMDAFLSRDAPSSTNSDQFLQKVAGQALAMLTMESADNCRIILAEPRNFIEELTSMISGNKHKYLAARLLQNLFLHIQLEFSKSDLRKLCETLSKVVEIIMDPEADRAELEVLIGLSSQICRVIPKVVARELENDQRKNTFVKRLVDALKENMNPAVHCPGIRRVIVELSIYLMVSSSHYAYFFNKYKMMDALLKVEQTPSRVERYMIFLGDVGFMEHKEPLTYLVDTAKELMCRQWH